MTREDALESGIRQAWRHLVVEKSDEYVTPVWAARDILCRAMPRTWNSDEIEGFAVGLQLVAVEVAEIARRRREAEAATSETPESKPDGEAFTYERVEVAGPAGDPIWVYQRRPASQGSRGAQSEDTREA